uniref:NADH-ubiquinone oxidoreductase chain 2 n=1 Tax=Nephaspis sp. DPP-2018 TaxID=2136114 RepID=A0A343YVL7_9CUCU|nr:NADH dehydrogenase subunit 2 [Nephaspis sp. DPP-2018]
MFLFVLVNSSLITISSYSWFMMWIGLEMNMFSFIPLMSENKNKLNSEASLKYFIIQSIASMMILMSILSELILNNSIELLSTPQSYLFSSALFMKLGMAPFHFWFPEIIEGMNWFNTLILLTWQKLAPFVILMYNFNMNLYYSVIIISSMLLSGILSWNQTNFKKILVYSSINHMGWMLSIIFLNKTFFLIYFLFYSLNSILLILPLKVNKINQLQQFYSSLNLNKTQKFMFSLNLLSLGGLPPFTGFFIKWMVLSTLIYNNHNFLGLTMVFLTLMMLFIYTRLTFPSFILKFEEFQFKSKFYSKFDIMNFFNLTSMTWFLVIYSFL